MVKRVLPRKLAVNLLQIADNGTVLVAGEHASYYIARKARRLM